MKRQVALRYVSFVLDDALGEHPTSEILPNATLVGWQCGFEPLFVAVQSYLPDVKVDAGDAADIAMDFLAERGWFSDEPTEPDYII